MAVQRLPMTDQRGFGLAELMMVVGIIGIIGMVVIPLFITYLRASETRGGAAELATLLNQARQMAIATNSRYQIEIDSDNNRLRFSQSTDGGNTYNTWIGPGTDDQGYRRLENQVRLANVSINPPNFTFNPLGTGSNGTITVQDSRNSSRVNVVVSNTGRIRICNPAGCP